MTRIEKILAAISQHGRLTAKKTSELTGIEFTEASKLVFLHRKHGGLPNIRMCGRLREGATRLSKVYEISDELDADDSLILPAIDIIEDAEEVDRRNLARLAARIQPFRDPMVFRTAGRAP